MSQGCGLYVIKMQEFIYISNKTFDKLNIYFLKNYLLPLVITDSEENGERAFQTTGTF